MDRQEALSSLQLELHNRSAKIESIPHRTPSGAGSGPSLGSRFGFGCRTQGPDLSSVKTVSYRFCGFIRLGESAQSILLIND